MRSKYHLSARGRNIDDDGDDDDDDDVSRTRGERYTLSIDHC